VEDMLFFGVGLPNSTTEQSQHKLIFYDWLSEFQKRKRGDKLGKSKGDMILYEILYVNT